MLFSFPHLFLAWVFVRAVGCSGCTPQERGCAAAACVWAYKNHDKKSEGNSAKQPAFGAACRAFAAWVCWAFVGDDDLFRCWALFYPIG
jgi:hypothetical protein